MALDAKKLEEAKVRRIAEMLRQYIVDIGCELARFDEVAAAKCILEEIELVEIEEFEKWHAVARNSPQEGQED